MYFHGTRQSSRWYVLNHAFIGVEFADLLDFVGDVIFNRQSQRAGLEPQVHVFGDDNHLVFA